MKYNNKIIRLIVSITALVLLITTGCSKETENRPGKDTIKIMDSIGRTVIIPGKIKRIACLYAFSGHVVVMLERGRDIVAVVNGLKRDKILTKICPTIKDATVPRYNGGLNIEELARVKPDVVFLKKSNFYHRGDFEKIRKMGIPAVVISFNDIKSQMNAVTIIGKVIGEKEKAKRYNSFFRKCLNITHDVKKQIPNEKKIRIYHSILEPLKTDCKGTLSSDWIEKAGLINVSVTQNFKGTGEDTYASLEQVILWNPDAIIVNEEGVDNYIIKEKKWSDIKAVKTKRVYKMPTGISRWGHPGSLETPLALLWGIKTFYPELTSKINLNNETRQFYIKFFRFELSENMIKKILKGEGMRKAKNKKRINRS